MRELIVILLAVSVASITTMIVHTCPVHLKHSVEQIQVDLNNEGENLIVDGVAGKLTIEAWMFRSTGWEAWNERILCK